MKTNNLHTLAENPSDDLQKYNYIIEYTETYRTFSDQDIELREVKCLEVQYRYILQPVQPGDRFAGRIQHTVLGFSPQMAEGFGYYFDEKAFNALMESSSLSHQQKERLREIGTFWQSENTPTKTRAAYPPDMAAILPSDNWNGKSGIAFPLYRMSGTQLDHPKLVRLGIPGLRAEIDRHYKEKTNDPKAHKLYTAMLAALDLFNSVCLRYAETVEKLVESAKPEQAEYLKHLADSLQFITQNPPATLHQAMQLSYLYTVLSGSLNYGRMDETLGDFLAADMDSGRLTEKQALEQIKALWTMMNEREGGIWIFDSRVIIGGLGRSNEKNADRFALLAIEATRQTHEVIPQLSLRFHKDQDPSLYQKALDCIGGGNPYPMLYNDDVNVPAVEHAFQISRNDAVHYVPFGCGEYILYHASVGTPSGVINLLQALLVTLHRGINPTTGKKMGLPENELGEFTDFDSLYNAWQKQVDYHITQLARQEELEYKIAGETSPFLFFSILYDDCIKSGRSIFDGGVRYLGGTLETYGNSNTADSLLAIKKLVYEEKQCTLEELITALDANFAGHDQLRHQCLNIAKYGNDNELADAMLVNVDTHVCEFTRNQHKVTGLHNYMVVIINNNANTVMGRYTCASPDGRKAFSFMNNGNAPASGMDKSGVTAFLNSIVKPDPALHAGAVQNMKFTSEMFNTYREKTESLLSTYFDNGGAQAMLNVLGRKDLENALEHPERYQNLIVRVGGFSARFVELEPDIQQEILARTLY